MLKGFRVGPSGIVRRSKFLNRKAKRVNHEQNVVAMRGYNQMVTNSWKGSGRSVYHINGPVGKSYKLPAYDFRHPQAS